MEKKWLILAIFYLILGFYFGYLLPRYNPTDNMFKLLLWLTCGFTSLSGFLIGKWFAKNY